MFTFDTFSFLRKFNLKNHQTVSYSVHYVGSSRIFLGQVCCCKHWCKQTNKPNKETLWHWLLPTLPIFMGENIYILNLCFRVSAWGYVLSHLATPPRDGGEHVSLIPVLTSGPTLSFLQKMHEMCPKEKKHSCYFDSTWCETLAIVDLCLLSHSLVFLPPLCRFIIIWCDTI